MNQLKVSNREKPTLITIGNRQAVSSGRWNHDCIAEYILANAKGRWIEIGELGKVAFGSKNESNRMRVRKRLPVLKRIVALHYNELLVVEYAGRHGSASAVKVYDRTSQADRQMMLLMVKRMADQRDKLTEHYKRITGLLLADEAMAAPPELKEAG